MTSYIDDLFTDKVPEPWQLRLPWAPVSAVEKERFRTNIKVIYRMYKYFDNQAGAFSGNPKAISSSEVYNNFISDDQEDLKELINDLTFGRKIVIPKTVDYTTVYAENLDSAGVNSRYIGECSFPKTKGFSENILSIGNDNETKLKIYPNPCDEKVYIQLSAIGSQNVKCNICDITGKLILSDDFIVNDNSPIVISTKDYPEGFYIVHIQSSDGDFNVDMKIIVNH